MGKHQELTIGQEERLRRAARLLATAAIRRAAEWQMLPEEDAALLAGRDSAVAEAPRRPE